MPERTHRQAPRRSKPWTAEELAVLQSAPPGTSHRELAVRLGRTTSAVSNQMLQFARRGA